MDSPVSTMLTMAVVTLSMKALISASVRPETETSLAMATWATESLFRAQWASSSFIVEYGYFGWLFLGGW